LKVLKNELTRIKDLFSEVKKNKQELLDTLTMVDDYLRDNISKLRQDEENICEKIRKSNKRLLPSDEISSANKEAAESPRITDQDLKVGESEGLRKNYDSLDHLGNKKLN